MLSILKKIFGRKSVDYKELVARGAQIVDVRTKAEFAGGHIKKSKNIPLQELKSQINTLDKSKPVVTCCASGIRSASAKEILQNNGFEVYNGGGWSSLQNKLS